MSSLLDEAIKVGQELESFEERKKGLQAQIEGKRKELEVATKEAEVGGRDIIQKAKNEASVIIKEAESIKKEYEQKLQEVVAREKAVEWVKSEDARLKSVSADLKDKEKATEDAKVRHLEAEHLYQEKLKTLTDWEKALSSQAYEASVKGLPSVKPSETKEPKKAKK